MNYSNALGAQWLDAMHSSIAISMTFDGLGEVPFTACPDDPEAHGREIFARAVAGDFGPVAEYVAPDVTPEMIVAQKKVDRQAEVDAIQVTTSAGNVFDGDEVSQNRMARAIIGMQTQPGITINWVLANNVPTLVDAAELTEALALAGLAQSEVWSGPYE